MSETESELREVIKRLKKELEITKSIKSNLNPKGPEARGCAQCMSCGRDGSEGSVMREVCLKVVRGVEKERDAAIRKLEETPDPHPNEMPPPPPVFGDDEAFEALRVWRGGKGFTGIMVRPTVFESPFHWGMTIAGIIRYVADASVREEVSRVDEDGTEERMSADDVIRELLEGLEHEMNSSTNTPKDWKADA